MKKSSWMDDFKAFIMRGNVLDLAVGVVIGTAFTAIVTAVVDCVITPLIGLAGGTDGISGVTLGIFPIGLLLAAIVNFLFVAFVVFWMVRLITKGMEKTQKAAEKEAAQAAQEAAAEAEPAPTTEELLAKIIALLEEKDRK